MELCVQKGREMEAVGGWGGGGRVDSQGVAAYKHAVRYTIFTTYATQAQIQQ